MRTPYLSGESRRKRCRAKVLAMLDRLPLDRDFIIVADDWRGWSPEQMKNYWRMIRMLKEGMREEEEYRGWDAEDWDSYLKDLFGIESKTELTRKEFSDFMQELQQMALYRYGIDIPNPT